MKTYHVFRFPDGFSRIVCEERDLVAELVYRYIDENSCLYISEVNRGKGTKIFEGRFSELGEQNGKETR